MPQRTHAYQAQLKTGYAVVAVSTLLYTTRWVTKNLCRAAAVVSLDCNLSLQKLQKYGRQI